MKEAGLFVLDSPFSARACSSRAIRRRTSSNVGSTYLSVSMATRIKGAHTVILGVIVRARLVVVLFPCPYFSLPSHQLPFVPFSQPVGECIECAAMEHRLGDSEHHFAQ